MSLQVPPRSSRRSFGRRAAIATLLGCGVRARAAVGGTLPAPSHDSILVVDGRVANTNDGSTACFDRSMLEGLSQASVQTRTPWYNGVSRFDGVPMELLMRTVGGSGSDVVATALNDYQCKIPVSDFARFGVLLALKRDGKYMSVRDKGPLFIVYPFDAYPELQSSTYTSRCAWQVRRITFV